MTKPTPGLYEQIVTQELADALRELEQDLVSKVRLRPAEADDRIASHVQQIVRQVIANAPDTERVATGVRVVQSVLSSLQAFGTDDFTSLGIPEPAEVLQALKTRTPDGKPRSPVVPKTPLLDTTLLTNAPGEPRIGHEVQTEIDSADRVDVVMAFIRLSGIRPLLEALEAHCRAGKRLRVVTTVYTGTTDAKALQALKDAGADVQVSYDVTSTRLHAKAWLFFRASGYSTAYVGSSNLTHSAQVSGLEWNVRISGARNPQVIDKIAAVFESYWHSPDFKAFDLDEFRERNSRQSNGPAVLLSPTELRPEPFQERLLELIALSRKMGHHRNLLVAATGTGKTVMAALDYARLRPSLQRDRLLFVAHRKEILQQALLTFRHALREPSFGELWVDGATPSKFEHVFASIQSLSAHAVAHLQPDHFDVVQVDEFHHAAAKSYTTLLEHITPRELLGLTATPERADELPILSWFDDRIAAELRLWDAIDQHRLVPFAYYGVHDGLDLRKVPWRRGNGYDVEGLTNLLTGDDAWARIVVRQLTRHVDSVSSIRALGFCVSVRHARFMARVFNEAGIRAVAVWGDSKREERKRALEDLARGDTNVLFSVDLFNEGVDVPSVDTLLLLRPTDSATLFLQQLGRGLRRSPGKSQCTVLDFVGEHRKEFSFARRLQALLGGSRKHVAEQVEQGFPFLPAGCHMELDAVASKVVLDNIKSSLPATHAARARELRQVALALGRRPRLAEFLSETGLDVEEVCRSQKSWSDLLEMAQLETLPRGSQEEVLRRACSRLLHVDDDKRLGAYAALVQRDTPPEEASSNVEEERLLRMLVGSVVDQAVTKDTPLSDGIALLWKHPQVLAEISEILEVLRPKVDHLHHDLTELSNCPLQVHARYTRIEVLAALGVGSAAKVAPWQTGVYWVEQANTDLFAFTLDKTNGQFSPTTRYKDYAINQGLVHWESQSVTRADGATGTRYQHHVELGSHVLLFARLRQDERAFWFLGPAEYVRHEGERPMAVTWRLKHPLPGDLYASFAAAVA